MLQHQIIQNLLYLPHVGGGGGWGFYERLVRSVKTPLKTVMGK